METKKAEIVSRDVIIFLIYFFMAVAVAFALRAIIKKFA